MYFMKKNEFAFLKDLVSLVELEGINQSKGWRILATYEDKRKEIIKTMFESDLFTDTTIISKYLSLKEEIIEYLNNSEKLLNYVDRC